MIATKEEIELMRRNLERWKKNKEQADALFMVAKEATSSLSEKIVTVEDWLFFNEPKTRRLKLCLRPEELPTAGDPKGSPAEWWFFDEEDERFFFQHEEKRLAKALGYKTSKEMRKDLKIDFKDGYEAKDGTIYEVTFKEDGTATIKEIGK